MCMALTDKKHYSIGRRWCIDAVLLHAMTDGTDKIYVKDGVYVDQMEDDGNGQKASISESHVY